jgi:hypothetical protein
MDEMAVSSDNARKKSEPPDARGVYLSWYLTPAGTLRWFTAELLIVYEKPNP